MIWPLPALLVWAGAWALFLGLRSVQLPDWAGLIVCTVAGAFFSLLGSTRWRQVFIGLGFPLSLLVSGFAGAVPAWIWLFPMLALLAVYPPYTWGDAPVFPTPRGALAGLSALAPLGPMARVVDAGCGVGDGLRELFAEYPQADIEGLEWSRPLRVLCAWRCRWLKVRARVRRADIWADDWSVYQMVYLFQRPESMPRAAQKAALQLKPGAWMASLEFEARDLEPTAVHTCPDGRPVWLYQQPFRRREPAAA
ncbi:MAG: hypothetical protein RLZZ618_2910 [Pseudomonadota bacterium]